MRYLIDGYNLAHQLTLRVGQVSASELARSRTDLLKHVAQRHGDQAGEVTVVFDAGSVRGIELQQTMFGIDVRMAVGEQADDVIERLVKAHSAPKQLTVVSDDHRIQAAGRHRGCIVQGCQEYLDYLDRPTAGSTEAPPPEKPLVPDPAETAQWEQAFSEPLPRRRGG
jgi:predicted RNA-binding protein with PIN domain